MNARSIVLAAAVSFAVAACHRPTRDASPSRERNTSGASPRAASEPVLVNAVVRQKTPDVTAATSTREATESLRTLVLRVPRAPKSILPAKHFDVAAWGTAVSTHTLLDEHGQGAVPVSEARFLWDDRNLYVLFYAGDLDLQIHNARRDGPVWRDDSFTLAFSTNDRKRMLSVSATGVLADGECPPDAAGLDDERCNLRWSSGARLAADYDGTINQLGDFDEEWNIELAIPLRRLLGTPPQAGAYLAMTLVRCEVAYDGPRACGRWGTAASPAELMLE